MRPGLEHDNQVHTVQTDERRSKSSGDHNIPDLMICTVGWTRNCTFCHGVGRWDRVENFLLILCTLGALTLNVYSKVLTSRVNSCWKSCKRLG